MRVSKLTAENILDEDQLCSPPPYCTNIVTNHIIPLGGLGSAPNTQHPDPLPPRYTQCWQVYQSKTVNQRYGTTPRHSNDTLHSRWRQGRGPR